MSEVGLWNGGWCRSVNFKYQRVLLYLKSKKNNFLLFLLCIKHVKWIKVKIINENPIDYFDKVINGMGSSDLKKTFRCLNLELKRFNLKIKRLNLQSKIWRILIRKISFILMMSYDLWRNLLINVTYLWTEIILQSIINIQK